MAQYAGFLLHHFIAAICQKNALESGTFDTGKCPPRFPLFIFCAIWVALLLVVCLLSVKTQYEKETDVLRTFKEKCVSESQQLKDILIQKNQEIETLQLKISELESLIIDPKVPEKVQVTEEGHDEEQIKREETIEGAAVEGEEKNGEEAEESFKIE